MIADILICDPRSCWYTICRWWSYSVSYSLNACLWRYYSISQSQPLLVVTLFDFLQSQCLLEGCPTILTLRVDGPFFIYFWFRRCVTNTKKDSFKWRKFLYETHWKISKSLARNHQILRSPRLLTLRPFLPQNSRVSVGTNYRSRATCYKTRGKTIVILQGNHSHKKGLLSAQLNLRLQMNFNWTSNWTGLQLNFSVLSSLTTQPRQLNFGTR